MTPLQIAIGELGTTEFPRNSNNVKYNTWYYGKEVSGDPYPWCMAFVQWCFNEAGYTLPYKTASCGSLLNWYKKNQPEKIIYTQALTPKFAEVKENDIVIFNWEGTNSNTDHTGIVKSKFGGYIRTIEGNTSKDNFSNGGQVLECVRHFSNVYAIIRPYEEGEYMTGKEIYVKLCDYLANQPLPTWAKEEYQQALNMGITDGTYPEMLIPRYQAAIMAKRAVEYYAKNQRKGKEKE